MKTPSAPKPLTPGQLRCLQGLAFGALHWSDIAKETFIAKVVPGKKTFHALTSAEAARLIDAMKREAGQPVTRPVPAERRRARSGDVATLVTPAQRELLKELRLKLGLAGHSAPYLDGILQRAAGVTVPRTSVEAERGIEALKAVLERRPATSTEPA